MRRLSLRPSNATPTALLYYLRNRQTRSLFSIVCRILISNGKKRQRVLFSWLSKLIWPIFRKYSGIKVYNNKKVLLRERKRHTARRVASTPYVVLTGYPPRQGMPPGQGTPPAREPPRPGYPPPGWTWQGTPPAAPWHSGKCCKALWDTGTPPLWTDRRTDTCQNITFPS